MTEEGHSVAAKDSTSSPTPSPWSAEEQKVEFIKMHGIFDDQLYF